MRLCCNFLPLFEKEGGGEKAQPHWLKAEIVHHLLVNINVTVGSFHISLLMFLQVKVNHTDIMLSHTTETPLLK